MRRFLQWHFWKIYFWPEKPEPAKSRQIARGRLRFLSIPAALCFITIAAQATNLSVFTTDEQIFGRKAQNIVERGPILDERGRLIASTVPVMVLHADPEKLLDLSETAAKLNAFLPKKTEEQIYHLLKRKTRYVELDRKITPKRHADILKLGLPGIYITPSTTRLYPHGREAAHLVGAVDIDGKGIAGIELSQNEQLSAGQSVHLSIDLGIQAIIRRTVAEQIDRFEAIGGRRADAGYENRRDSLNGLSARF